MEIGDKEGAPFTTEPIEDPFGKPAPVETPADVPVEVPEEPLVPVGHAGSPV